jgi:nitroreductase
MDLASIDELLTTTRSVRKRLDLTRCVPEDVIRRGLEIALQAPTGSNSQGWHFLVVTDPEKRRALGELYQQAFTAYASAARHRPFEAGDPRAEQYERIYDSARHLADHLGEVPVHVIPCVEGRVEQAGAMAQASLYGSILPAVWSFMLALRARGIGSAWTTLHLAHEQRVAELLGLPENLTQAALLPVAYFTGDGFRPARRLPSEDRTHWDTWQGRRTP